MQQYTFATFSNNKTITEKPNDEDDDEEKQKGDHYQELSTFPSNTGVVKLNIGGPNGYVFFTFI